MFTAHATVPTVTLHDAVQRTLADNPAIKSEGEIQKQREGLLQTAAGSFDWVAFSRWSHDTDRLPLSTVTPFANKQVTDAESYTSGFGHQFRTGIIVQPHVTVFGLKNNLTQPVTEYRSNLAIDITIPLLRNLGRGATAADETAARLGVNAGARLYEHAVAQRIARTATAYWNCLAARRNYEIVSDTEERATKLVKFVELLVGGGELGVGSRDKAQAELLKRTAQRREAELAYYQARQVLALAMGYGPTQLAEAPMAGGDFPTAPRAEIVAATPASDLVRLALERRGDYLAALQNVEIEQVQLVRARNQLKPRLDFTLTAGYAGIEDRADDRLALSSLSHRLTGGNVVSALALEWPVANHAARGEVARRRARVAATEYDTQTAANSIASGVLVTVEAVRLNLAQYHATAESTRIYAGALKVEQDNVSSGESTLLDLIDLEERYATARTTEIDALRAYATSLVDLRFVTGTLLENAGPRAVFNANRLLSAP